MFSRRTLLAGLGASIATPAVLEPAFAQHHAGHDPVYSHLTDPKIKTPPLDTMKLQHVFDSPAPPAAQPGPLGDARRRCRCRAARWPGPPRSNNRMHVVGGYGEQRVDRPYHHVYDQASDKWLDAPLLPRGANHVGVAVVGRQALRHRRLRRAEPQARQSLLRARRRNLARRSRRYRKPSRRHRLRRDQRHAACDRRRRRRHLRRPRSRSTGIWSTIRASTNGRRARRCRPAATIPARWR